MNSHTFKQFAGPILMGWILPAAMVVILFVFTTDPNRPLEDFSRVEFKPAVKEVIRGESKSRTKRADHFELWLEAPNGSRFFHRDPEPEPIDRYFQAIPEGEILSVSYDEGHEGNRIVNIRVLATGADVLPLDEIQAAERTKRWVIGIAALIFFLVGNGFLLVNVRALKGKA